MAMQRPALSEIVERVEQDIASRLGIGAPARISLARVLARAVAGLGHGLYGYINTKEKNFLPDTGDDDAVLRWASLFNVPRISAVAAAGSVQATGSNGVVIPAGWILQNSDGSVQFTVDADATIASGIAEIEITAIDRGDGGNVSTGASLNFLSPIAGVLSSVTVLTPGITGGSDIETIEALRVRVLDRMQAPPKGGAASDYVEWAKAAHPDVTRVWVAGQEMAENSVTVRVVTDDAVGGLIPTETVLDAVAEYIETRRPVTAEVYIAAPVAVDLDLSIALSPNTQTVRDAVEAELTDLIKREASPGGTILLTRINEAISTAAGEFDHSLILPTDNVEHDTGEIAVLGDITWSTL